MKVKICGITNLEDARIAINLGADAIGYIFYAKSKRYINPQQAKDISLALPPFVIKVGVFVNEEIETVNKVSKIAGLNLVQLHGEETPDYCDNINLPVVKAFRVNEDFNFGLLSEYKVAGFLLDAFDEKEYGGTGKKFNWDIIPANLRNKIILAGGISAENVTKVINEINPYAVDVSSSVEKSQGKKDYNKIEKLMFNIHSKG